MSVTLRVMSDQGLTRRHVIGSAAVLGVGGPLLAACGSDDDSGGNGGEADVEAPETGTELVSRGDVPVGGGVILEDQKIVVTQATDGEFRAFGATCTHQACSVTGVTKTIDCSCHGSKFSLTDGSVEQGPATEPLPEVEITVDGDRILSA